MRVQELGKEKKLVEGEDGDLWSWVEERAAETAKASINVKFFVAEFVHSGMEVSFFQSPFRCRVEVPFHAVSVAA